MFALHAQHGELENRRKRAQFCYKKVAAKRFVKVFNRLGRKQSKLQIFPLFHTYPFKAENPPPLQLLQHPRGTSGFRSFLLQPLQGSPGLSMAQGVTDRALQGPGHRQGGHREDGWAVPALQNQPQLLKHLLVQKAPACPPLDPPCRGLQVLQGV